MQDGGLLRPFFLRLARFSIELLFKGEDEGEEVSSSVCSNPRYFSVSTFHLSTVYAGGVLFCRRFLVDIFLWAFRHFIIF